MAGIQAGSLQVVAIVAVNACGNVYDPDTGRALAGVYDRGNIADPMTIFDQMADDVRDLPQGNTTIGCVITNARLSKAQCNKIASITHARLCPHHLPGAHDERRRYRLRDVHRRV